MTRRYKIYYQTNPFQAIVPHLPAAQTAADAGKAARPSDTACAGEAEPAADVPACHTQTVLLRGQLMCELAEATQ